MSETTALFVGWGVSAAFFVLVATRTGPKETRPWNLVTSEGDRSRVSLTNLQLTLWTIVVLSLMTGLFVARLIENRATALDFEIPPELLLVMGISATSMVLSSTIPTPPADPAKTRDASGPRLLQATTTPEGAQEVSRFQNFWLTIIVVVAYVALAVATFADPKATFDKLPTLSPQIVTLLAISHGGYLAKKTADNTAKKNG